MKTKALFFTILVLSLWVGCSSQTGQVAPSGYSASTDADNTGRNLQDRNTPNLTPIDQGENKQDIEISANIRKAIVDDGSLSTNAHNVKIITAKGVVTLRGPVKSQQEKATIEAKAKGVPHVSNVNNLLEIEARP